MTPDDIIEAMVNTADDWAPAGCVGLNKAEISIMLRAALAAAEAKGWKLVPREYTPDMVEAGRAAIENAPDLGGIVFEWTPEACDCWWAMYDAAPSVKP